MASDNPITVQYNGVDIRTCVAHNYNSSFNLKIPYGYNYRNCIFGLGIRWGTNPADEKVASLRLCHNDYCVIIQLHHLGRESVPESLKSLFADSSITFVGVSAKEDLLQLKQDYGLECSGRVHDLLPLADMVYGFKDHFNIDNTTQGMDRLAQEIFGITIDKPDRLVTRSDWGIKFLTADQIKYATIDAYLSFFIGSNLLASRK
ncbi:hypothetical protein MKW94_020507 [Papaver nudicaule]|uniref:3'-5' exonuclease domain-containing protein n=1 Tax=Papaver nudicaule TaxID=74823 RepID=A0AA41VM81_PAPNU|nr:hypothetical protein [Papaver nudicaule]